MNTMTNKNDIRELTIDELDMVEGASAEGIAASTSAVGGMTAVHGMYEITDYVLGMAAGAVLAGK
jgi:hypothetical protein